MQISLLRPKQSTLSPGHPRVSYILSSRRISQSSLPFHSSQLSLSSMSSQLSLSFPPVPPERRASLVLCLAVPCQQKKAGAPVRNTRLKNKFKKTAATYSPALHCSTIGASGLNCSVRNGKRWDTAAITAINLSAAKSIKTIRDIND